MRDPRRPVTRWRRARSRTHVVNERLGTMWMRLIERGTVLVAVMICTATAPLHARPVQETKKILMLYAYDPNAPGSVAYTQQLKLVVSASRSASAPAYSRRPTTEDAAARPPTQPAAGPGSATRPAEVRPRARFRLRCWSSSWRRTNGSRRPSGLERGLRRSGSQSGNANRAPAPRHLDLPPVAAG